jgi:hypothetical protein
MDVSFYIEALEEAVCWESPIPLLIPTENPGGYISKAFTG